MAMAVQQIHPIAHLPLVLGVLRRLEVATCCDLQRWVKINISAKIGVEHI